MRALYVSGLRGAARRWPLVGVLFGASAIFGVTFGALAWSWLVLALDNSLATRTLLRNLDMNVFVDLFMHHGDSLQMLLMQGVLLIGVSVLVWVWLNALAVVAVAEPQTCSACAHRALEVYPTFLLLWLLSSLVTAGFVGGVALLASAGMRWSVESPSEMTRYWILLASVVIGILLVLFSTAVHDHARIHTVATGAGASRAYLWALVFVGQRSKRAFPLAALLAATAGALVLFSQSVAWLVPTDSVPGLVTSIAWGQLMLLSRAFVRLWCFAAETDLQNLSDVRDATSS